MANTMPPKATLMDHPMATPISRGLAAAIPLAMMISAMKEGRRVTNWDDLLPKTASAKTGEERFWGYLYDNFDDIEKEATAILDNYMNGFAEACGNKGVDAEELVKQAQHFTAPGGQQMAMPQNMPQAAPQGGNAAWDIGKYFIPVVGSGYMAADAAGNAKDMFAKNRSWKQRLASGAAALGNTGMAALGLIPGLGQGANLLLKGGLTAGKLAMRGGKLGRLLGMTGKGMTRTGQGIKGMGGAGGQFVLNRAGGADATGKALRFLGYGKNYKGVIPRGMAQAPGRAWQGMTNAGRRVMGRPTQAYAGTPFMNNYAKLQAGQRVAPWTAGATAATTGMIMPAALQDPAGGVPQQVMQHQGPGASTLMYPRGVPNYVPISGR
jgi:hypothetical protein